MKTKYYMRESIFTFIYIFPPNKTTTNSFCLINENALYQGTEPWAIEEMPIAKTTPITYKQARKILGTKNLNKALAIVKGL